MAWLNKPVRFFFLDGDEMVGKVLKREDDLYLIEDQAGQTQMVPIYGIKRMCEEA